MRDVLCRLLLIALSTNAKHASASTQPFVGTSSNFLSKGRQLHCAFQTRENPDPLFRTTNTPHLPPQTSAKMGGKKGAEGMCTVQKDYLQGRKKKDDKTNLKETNGEKDPLEGKVLDSSGNKILDRGTFKEFKICLQCKQVMVWRKAWERSWNEVRYCSDKCRAQGKKAARAGAGGAGTGAGAGEGEEGAGEGGSAGRREEGGSGSPAGSSKGDVN